MAAESHGLRLNSVRLWQYVAYTNGTFVKNACDRKTKNCLMSEKWRLTNFWKRTIVSTHYSWDTRLKSIGSEFCFVGKQLLTNILSCVSCMCANLCEQKKVGIFSGDSALVLTYSIRQSSPKLVAPYSNSKTKKNYLIDMALIGLKSNWHLPGRFVLPC